MKYDYRKGFVRSLIGIMILIMCYFGPWGFMLGRTYKNYYYSKDGKHCFTIIAYSGDGVDFLKSFSPDFDASVDNGRGIYLIPGKFNGRLPKDNYVRLDYIGGLPSDTFYFGWENDSLTIRLADWTGVIIENKLHPEVKIDMELSGYEGSWNYDMKDELDKRVVEEWEKLRAKYQYVLRKDLRMY